MSVIILLLTFEFEIIEFVNMQRKNTDKFSDIDKVYLSSDTVKVNENIKVTMRR